MKILDKYVAKNFLIGYCIAFCVLIGLRIIIDLFVNLDEFAEHADLGALAVTWHVVQFYSLHTTLYFRDVAGMITVVAAAFSLGKMVRANELVAIMASGVSLKRVVGPILCLSLIFTGLFVIDQELIIPALSHKLVRHQSDLPGQESYYVWFIVDGKGSLICSRRFDVKTSTFHDPTVITRQRTEQPGIWKVTGRVSGKEMTYNSQTGMWDLVDGWFYEAGRPDDPNSLSTGPRRRASYDAGDLDPKDIPVRSKVGYKEYLSSRQLGALAAQGTKVKDVAQLISQKQFRITDPIINIAMLMVSLPVLVCRDPKTMKSAVLVSFAITATCFVATFACKMLATEVVFDRVMPEVWAWLPVFIFVPLAFIELDSMKT